MNSRTRNRLTISLGLLFIFFLALYNLDTYPVIWFDEGLHLQPPKNLILYSKYAIKDNGVLHPFDSSVSTGPPLLLPIALSFRLLTIDLWPARFVTVIYLMLSAATLYQLGRTLFNNQISLLALALIVASPGLDFIPLGRQVMGEIPALFFFLMGTLIWVYADRRQHLGLLGLAGIAFGLAMITKNIYGLILPLSWLFLTIIGLRNNRQIRSVYIILLMGVGLICLAAWYTFQLFSLGLINFQEDVLSMGASSGRSIFVFDRERILTSFRFLLGPNFYLALGIPGLLYQIYVSRRQQFTLMPQRLFLLVTSIVWLIWYAFFSIGWHRYAFPLSIMTAFFVADLLFNGASGLRHLLQHETSMRLTTIKFFVNNIGLATIIVLLTFFPIHRESLYEEIRAIYYGNDRTPQIFAAFLNKYVSPNDLIESWEWPIDFFTNHTYHHPSSNILDLMTRSVFLGDAYSFEMYDFEKYNPKYIINGSFSKWTGLYSTDYLHQNCELITSIGAYDLYRVK